MLSSRSLLLVLTVWTVVAPAPSAQTALARTRVVVLGVTHSAQLVAETQRPALFRAFLDRVAPNAVAVERDPQSFARNDLYDFTYEVQHLVLPWARERGVPVYPVDWLPPTEDQRLLFGTDLEVAPFVRPTEGYGAFYAFPDSSVLSLPLLYADTVAAERGPLGWADAPAEQASSDGARRLFLYRTFLQARRVLRAAQNHPGGLLLLVVGDMHKPDIERVLAGYPQVEVVAPSSFGLPTDADVAAEERVEDVYAVATFNLLGVQPRMGVVDYGYLSRAVERLEQAATTPEIRLLRTRLGVLTGALPAGDAAERYRRIREDVGPDAAFTWTGVKERGRLDSYFDPFGNLTVGQRAAVEQARELYKLGRAGAADAIEEELAAALPGPKAVQLHAYWHEHVHETP